MTDSTDTKDLANQEDAPPPAAQQQGGDPAAQAPDSPMKLAGTLTVVALVAAAALAGANECTKGPIKAARARVKLAGIKKVLPQCTNNPVADKIFVKDARGKKTTVYRCRIKQADGTSPVVAVAIEQNSGANKNKPYSGLIKVLSGFDT